METYRQLMKAEPSIPEHLEKGHPLTPGVLGGLGFLDRLPQRVRTRFRSSATHIPVDSIANHVSKIFDVTVETIHSRCRERTLILARALIAWYATEHGGATLTEAARFLRRDVSTVSRMIGRYRRRQPDLFSLTTFKTLSQKLESSCADKLPRLSHTTSGYLHQ